MPKAPRRRQDRRPPPDRASAGLRELQDMVNLAAGEDHDGIQVRRVHPAQATKAYACPGCQQEIPARTAHLVVVPLDAPDLRRHWHTSCWLMRERRRPGH